MKSIGERFIPFLIGAKCLTKSLHETYSYDMELTRHEPLRPPYEWNTYHNDTHHAQ